MTWEAQEGGKCKWLDCTIGNFTPRVTIEAATQHHSCYINIHNSQYGRKGSSYGVLLLLQPSISLTLPALRILTEGRWFVRNSSEPISPFPQLPQGATQRFTRKYLDLLHSHTYMLWTYMFSHSWLNGGIYADWNDLIVWGESLITRHPHCNLVPPPLLLIVLYE